MRHAVVVADGDQDAAGSGADGFVLDVGTKVQVELFESLVAPSARHSLGHCEDHEQDQHEDHAGNGGDSLGEQVGDRHKEQNSRRDGESNRNLDSSQSEVERHLVLLVFPLEAQHQDAQRFQKEAPHNAERIGFTQQVDIAPAQNDRDDLKTCDQVDDSIRGAELPVRFLKGWMQYAIFSHTVHHAVGADDRGVHRSRKDQHAHDDDEDVKAESKNLRTHKVHRQAARAGCRCTAAGPRWE